MLNNAKAQPTMSCKDCQVKCQRFGKHRNGLRRFRCPKCKRTFTEPHTRTLGEMYISWEKALLALQLLLEGNSIRSHGADHGPGQEHNHACSGVSRREVRTGTSRQNPQ